MSDCLIHGVAGPHCTQECDDAMQAARRRHDCEEYAVEYGDEPRPNGVLKITTRCYVCGRTLGVSTDRVLWA